MTESKMQYLISLSDKTIEQLIELQREWGISRDEVIEMAIVYTYQSIHKPVTKSMGEAVQATVSSLAMALIQENLEKGRDVSIPSLGIVIEGKKKEE